MAHTLDATLIAEDKVVAAACVDLVAASTTKQHVVETASRQDVIAAIRVGEANRADFADREFVNRPGRRWVIGIVGRDLRVVANHNVGAQTGDDISVTADNRVATGPADDDVIAVTRRDEIIPTQCRSTSQ